VRASWEVLGARARGLGTHLLAGERLREVERATSIGGLMHALRDTPYARVMGPREAEPAQVEAAVTRSVAERMGLLARWTAADPRALRPIFIGQDARNVRDILRGIVGALTPEQRLASAMPTPSLGRKELEALARSESVGAVAATLVGWGHPLGSALLDEASQAHPDPFRLEAALAKRTAEEAVKASRRGGRLMRSFVREDIDAHNAVTALLLAGARTEGEPADLFVEGGSSLSVDDFVRAASATDRGAASTLLATATAGSVLAAPLRERPVSPAALSARIMAARIDDLARRGRQEPLSAAPVLLFVLRLHREARIVRRALWGAALAGEGRA
jgi:vacuolar-type H+-ATPase subunit C/Vma6